MTRASGGQPGESTRLSPGRRSRKAQADKFSKGDKRRYYVSAIGSSTEAAAMLDACLQRKLVAQDRHRDGKKLLDRIVACSLVKSGDAR